MRAYLGFIASIRYHLGILFKDFGCLDWVWDVKGQFKIKRSDKQILVIGGLLGKQIQPQGLMQLIRNELVFFTGTPFSDDRK